MKLQKSLLQAVALGLALGASTASCSILDNSNDVKPQSEEKANDENVDDKERCEVGHTYDCPACGMG